MSLTVLGGIALDLIDRPQQILHGPVLGGSAAYAALAAAPLTDVRMVSVVGSDLGNTALSFFEDAGVDISEVAMRQGRTAVWTGRYMGPRDHRRTAIAEQGVAADFFPKVSQPARMSRGLMLGAGNPAVQLAVRKQFPSSTLVGIDTIDHWIADDSVGVRASLATANVIFIGNWEARQLTNHREPVDIAAALGLQPDQALVLKGGKRGSWLLLNEQWDYVPAFEVSDVRDPTGAGDAYAGAFMAYASRASMPLSRRNFVKAMLYGTAVASILVEDYGLAPLVGLRREPIDERVAVLSSHSKTPPG